VKRIKFYALWVCLLSIEVLNAQNASQSEIIPIAVHTVKVHMSEIPIIPAAGYYPDFGGDSKYFTIELTEDTLVSILSNSLDHIPDRVSIIDYSDSTVHTFIYSKYELKYMHNRHSVSRYLSGTIKVVSKCPKQDTCFDFEVHEADNKITDVTIDRELPNLHSKKFFYPDLQYLPTVLNEDFRTYTLDTLMYVDRSSADSLINVFHYNRMESFNPYSDVELERLRHQLSPEVKDAIEQMKKH